MRTELAHGTWRRLAVGVLLTRPDEPTRSDWADLGIALAGPGAALSGWDAVRLRGLGSSRPPSDRVLVVSPTAMSRTIGQVRIQRSVRQFTRHLQPLGAPFELVPVVGTARAVTDTALQQHHDLVAVRALVTGALQRRQCELAELVEEYERGPRRNSAGLRLALTEALDGARSAAEADAARRLAAGPIPPFELNVSVVDQHGTLLYVVDELWRELRAGVEIDSRRYHLHDDSWEKTLDRHNDLTRWGLAMLHYSPRRITAAGSRFVPDVRDFLVRRARELGVPVPAGRGVRRPTVGDTPSPFVIHR